MKLFVNDETAPLEVVILGIGEDRGQPRDINPMIRKHLSNNTFPSTNDICCEIEEFERILRQNNINALRPDNIPNVEQIFVRDIGFVIEDYFFIANMRHRSRSDEIKGIKHVVEQFEKKVIKIPEGVIIEGGDIILWNDYIFIGIGDRTSVKGADFIKKTFPNKKVIMLELTVDQTDPSRNVLHLDCIFQPIGRDEAIIYLRGFKTMPYDLLRLFPSNKLIKINLEQKDRMFSNIFSISPEIIIIETGFTELKIELENRNYTVYEINYKETSKLNGLLRCSTLPLRRSKL
ncbi:MAG: amidinotransferase [Muricauda sp. TMED12]|nr:MAG: amidinotransferase [Muricauda sp. TMED12]